MTRARRASRACRALSEEQRAEVKRTAAAIRQGTIKLARAKEVYLRTARNLKVWRADGGPLTPWAVDAVAKLEMQIAGYRCLFRELGVRPPRPR